MQSTVPEPVFLNVEYLFFLVFRAVGGFFQRLFSKEFWQDARLFATVLVILLIALILFYLVRLYEMKQEGGKAAATPKTPPSITGAASAVSALEGAPVRNELWESIRAKLLSDNQSDWRLAIIEADIYMDRLLDDKGYHGDTTSDKLKQIIPPQLASVQIAWEAHKVRNRIAHDGAAFTLTQPEARRVLSYFEIVFRDLEAI